jgi:LysR family transcriptional regulator (chromosome initiation inhibitor)
MYEPHQLQALTAAVAEGTFEAAARALHVTPSAISQRVRALETATGRVLLVRSKPVRATSSGEVLLRLARQTALLSAETAAELGEADGPTTLTVAVSADALATWVLPALAPLAADTCFHLLREDESWTSELLRGGAAVAAVTAESRPVAGCVVTPLGSMRYRPMAAPAFAARWFPDGATAEALHRAPVVVFDRVDRLQHDWLRRRTGADADPPSHLVPSTADYTRAVELGLGWGMVPELLATPDDGRPAPSLVEIDPGEVVAVPLFWQQWRLRTPALDRLAAAVTTAAREALGRP